MCRYIALFAVLTTAALAPSAAVAKLHSIENKFLVVTYDDVAKTFSIIERATGQVFLKDGKLDGNPKRVVTGSIHSFREFGQGNDIMVDREDGGWTMLELYPDVPFVFVCGQLCNYGKEPLDIKKVVPATFTLDLGKPASELRTLGTAGLTTPDKNPGSYLFLTLADPATRRGVVAGWLTQ